MLKSVATILLSLAALLAACQKEAEKPPERVVVADSVLSADSTMIHFTSYGESDKAVVLVHGWSCDQTYWSRQVEAFKDEYQVVTIDLAGHGLSAAGREEWTMTNYGYDIAAVVNKLGLEEVALVGHSMGGPVCIEGARQLPEQTVVVIGVDTYQRLSQQPEPEQIEGFVTPFKTDFASAVNNMVTGIMGPNADSSLVAEVVADMAQADPAVAIASFEGLFAYDAAAALADMRKPIRAINCDLWPTDVEGNRSVAESFEVEIIEGVGHFPQMEVPGEFNIRLRKVLHEFWPVDESK